MRHRLSASSVVWSLGVFLAVLGWCRIDWAQDIHLTRGRQGSRTPPILLLSRPDIQDELALSPELVTSAKSLAIELQRKVSALHGKTGDGILTARRAIDDEQTQWLNKNLSQPQLDRLHQLHLQWEGPAAFLSRPIIADYLSLSASQRQAIAQAIADHDLRRGQIQKPSDSEEAFARQILAILTDPQRSQWLTLLGKPFQFRPDPPSQDPQPSGTPLERPR